MYNAPSVNFPVGRPLFLGVGLAALWLLGVCLSIGWWLLQPTSWSWLPLSLSLVTGGWVAWWWQQLRQGTLIWDGQQWAWPEAGQGLEAHVSVRLDVQRAMWLSFDPAGMGGAPLWLWVQANHSPSLWGDLRRAVYARPSPDRVAGLTPTNEAHQ